MRLLICHLSDLHIKDRSSPVLRRAEKIAAAMNRPAKEADAIILLWSGDIAFSGLAEQYAIAREFFGEIRAHVESGHPELQVFTVGIPGNHDCDLRSPSDVRDVPAILNRVQTLSLQGETVRHCLSVQNEFFAFLGDVGSNGCPSTPLLFWEVRLAVDEEVVAVRCHNTAWLTQNPERPAHLYFPLSAVEESPAESAVTISTFHHPYNWLRPENAIEFKRYIEQVSDIVLTGHEHERDQYIKSREANYVRFVEAAALFDPTHGGSAFNLIVVDSEAGKYTVWPYSWSRDMYSPAGDGWQTEFARNPKRETPSLFNTEKFARYLNDIGTGFTHPRKDQLVLDDLFVYPELYKAPLQQKIEGKKTAVRIPSKDCSQVLTTAGRAIVIGQDKSGKSTLGKMIYRHALSSDFTPLLLGPNDVEGVDSSSINRSVDRAIEIQYGKQNIERVRQLSVERLLVVFDDFHKVRLTRKGQTQLLSALERIAGSTILLVGDAFPLYELTSKTEAEHPFGRYHQFQIQEFGRVLRGDLIEKWVRLGQEYVGDDAEIFREIEQRERMIQAILSKRLVSSYPVTVLSFMQAGEASKVGARHSAGAYGELFESLITEKFRHLSPKNTEIGKKYTIVSRIAYAMFKRGMKHLTEGDIQAVIREYFAEYRVSTDSTDLIAELVRGDILTNISGRYEFRYIYYFHYFVARYFHENISDPDERESLSKELGRMADRVYRDDYVDILVFYIYLSRDLGLVAQIKSNASRIYDDYPPSDLDSDVDFINRLYLREPEPIALPALDIDRNRRELRSAADERDVLAKLDRVDDEVEYQKDLNDVIKLNIAFKTLYILGQVLRSFPGVLKQPVKVGVAQECYRLSLRVLSVVLRAASQNLDDLRRYFAEVIRESQQIDSPRRLAQSADELTIWLAGACAYGIIKRVSLAVGHEDLGETYKDVRLLEDGNLAVDVIDLAIKLDNFRDPPENEIRQLANSKKNYFVYSLVRELVRQHLALFQIHPRVRERIVKMLNFQKRGPVLVEKSLVK